LKKSICILICLLVPFVAHAQVKTSFFQDIEIFAGAGTSHYFGDIGGKDTAWHASAKFQAVFDNLDIDWDQSRLMLSAGARFTRWRNFALTVQLTPVFLSGNDRSSNYEYRKFQFSSTLIEFSALGEYYLANRLTGVAPYVFLGAGGLYSFGSANFVVGNDYLANIVSPWRHYTASGASMQFGLGLRLPSVNRMTHSFDIAYHFTTTDLLDGLTTNRKTNDLFVTVAYKINIESYSLWTYDHRGRVK